MDREFDSDSAPSPLVSTTASADESVTMAVVIAMGAVQDTPPTELPPLYEAVNPDALETLFSRQAGPGRVTFRYCEHVVSVDADGQIEIYERAD